MPSRKKRNRTKAHALSDANIRKSSKYAHNKLDSRIFAQ